MHTHTHTMPPSYFFYNSRQGRLEGRRRERWGMIERRVGWKKENIVKVLRKNYLLCVGGCVCARIGLWVHMCEWTDERFYWCRQITFLKHWNRFIYANGSANTRRISLNVCALHEWGSCVHTAALCMHTLSWTLYLCCMETLSEVWSAFII